MIKIISSMATRLLLVDLAAQWQAASSQYVSVESVGGLDAAERVQAGEAFDGAVLGLGAIDKLIASGHLVAGSRVDLASSNVAVAIKAGSPLPDISTEAALRSAVSAAHTIGYSTGPSGVAVIELFERWGLSESLKSKIVQTPPGVPVGSLVARDEVALGFQQLSELMHLDGITVVGSLPQAVAITTVFSAGLCSLSTQPGLAVKFFAFMAGGQADAAKVRHGMTAI